MSETDESRAGQIEWLAERISPEREGWAWRECPQMQYELRGDGQGAKRVPVCATDCECCGGTGRVPVALDRPEQVAMVFGWARKRPWWLRQVYSDSSTAWTNRDAMGAAMVGPQWSYWRAQSVFAHTCATERQYAKEHPK